MKGISNPLRVRVDALCSGNFSSPPQPQPQPYRHSIISSSKTHPKNVEKAGIDPESGFLDLLSWDQDEFCCVMIFSYPPYSWNFKKEIKSCFAIYNQRWEQSVFIYRSKFLSIYLYYIYIYKFVFIILLHLCPANCTVYMQRQYEFYVVLYFIVLFFFFTWWLICTPTSPDSCLSCHRSGVVLS